MQSDIVVFHYDIFTILIKRDTTEGESICKCCSDRGFQSSVEYKILLAYFASIVPYRTLHYIVDSVINLFYRDIYMLICQTELEVFQFVLVIPPAISYGHNRIHYFELYLDVITIHQCEG